MTKTTAPAKVGVSRNIQPGFEMKTITGLERAGGCTVLVNIMIIMAVPTAAGSAHQKSAKQLRKSSPMNVQITCPMMVLRGCARGESGKPNKIMQEAPKDPSMSGIDCVRVSVSSTVMARNPPKPDSSAMRRVGRAGTLA